MVNKAAQTQFKIVDPSEHIKEFLLTLIKFWLSCLVHRSVVVIGSDQLPITTNEFLGKLGEIQARSAFRGL